MDDAELQARGEMVTGLAQKAAAMRKAVYEESLRYEGSVGAIKQAIEEIDAELRDNQQAMRESKIDHVIAESTRNALVAAHRRLSTLMQHAQDGLVVQRGKLMQADETLMMLRAFFSAPKPVEASPPVSLKPGKHPGQSVAQKRRLEAVQQNGNGAAD